MKCPRCQTEMLAGSQFCHHCGTRLEEMGLKPEDLETGTGPRATPAPALRVSRTDPEQDVWQGTFSPRAMVPAWCISFAVSIVAAVLWAALRPSAETNPGLRRALNWGLPLVILAAWLYPTLLLVYRRLNIHYRLTTQRLFHRTGILSRTTNRIEVIEMADITFRQGLIERMLGVGTIRVTSGDPTDPLLVLQGIENVAHVAAQFDDVRRKEQLRRGTVLREI